MSGPVSPVIFAVAAASWLTCGNWSILGPLTSPDGVASSFAADKHRFDWIATFGRRRRRTGNAALNVKMAGLLTDMVKITWCAMVEVAMS